MNVKKEMQKPRCEKLFNLIKKIKETYKVEEVYTDNSVSYYVTKSGVEDMVLKIVFYTNSWRLSVEDKDFVRSFRGTTKINSFVDEMMKILSEDTKPTEVTHPIDELTNFEISLSLLNDTVDETLMDNHACIEGPDYDKEKVHEIFYTFEPVMETDALNWFAFYRYAKDNSADMNEFDRFIMLSLIARRIVEFMRSGKEYDCHRMNANIMAESNPICYAHVLQYYGGKCHNLHGHNGKITVSAKMDSYVLRERPMLVSYGFLKGFLKYMDKILDHKTFIHVNPYEPIVIDEDNNVTFETDRISLTFKNKESYVLIPVFENSPYMTSEMTLMNYVIPSFYMYLINFIMTESVDNTELTMFQLDEPVIFTFKWAETDSTVCSLDINI